MTTVIGVDPSIAATGVASWTDGRIATYTMGTNSKLPVQRRWRQIVDPLWTHIDRAHLEDLLIVVEQPNKGAKGSGLLTNIGLWAVLTDSWSVAGSTFVDVQPSQLKKFALGKGSGKGTDKEQVLLAIERRYGHLVSIKDNNQADAFAMMAMACEHYGIPLRAKDGGHIVLPASHTEKLDNIKWPEWSPTWR